MSTILVALDFSDLTADVLAAARSCAKEGNQLWLLHVAPDDPEYVEYRVGPEDEREDLADQLQALRDRIHAEADRLRGAGIEVEAFVVQGRPAERIIAEAERWEAAMIVMGRHRHGRLHDLLVGSVAERVLRHASCPVLVIPPREGGSPTT